MTDKEDLYKEARFVSKEINSAVKKYIEEQPEKKTYEAFVVIMTAIDIYRANLFLAGTENNIEKAIEFEKISHEQTLELIEKFSKKYK